MSEEAKVIDQITEAAKRRAEEVKTIKTTAENLKSKHGLKSIHVVEVPNDKIGEPGHVLYIRPITRHAFTELTINGKDDQTYAAIVRDTLAIREQSSDEFWEDDAVFLASMMNIINILEVKKSTLTTY